MFKGGHSCSIWYLSEPQTVPIPQTSFLVWTFFCRFLLRVGSRYLLCTMYLFVLVVTEEIPQLLKKNHATSVQSTLHRLYSTHIAELYVTLVSTQYVQYALCKHVCKLACSIQVCSMLYSSVSRYDYWYLKIEIGIFTYGY